MKQSHKTGLFPFFCYIMVFCLNLGWLWMKDRWSLSMQMAIPVLSFLLGGLGVWWRTQGDANIETTSYVRKALWVFTLYYMAILSVLLFFGGLFHLDRGWGGSVNLVPFHSIPSTTIFGFIATRAVWSVCLIWLEILSLPFHWGCCCHCSGNG